jgi:hypothetical protein
MICHEGFLLGSGMELSQVWAEPALGLGLVTDSAREPESESDARLESSSFSPAPGASSGAETFIGMGLVGSVIPAARSASICGSVRRSKPQMWERTAARRGEMRFWAKSA